MNNINKKGLKNTKKVNKGPSKTDKNVYEGCYGNYSDDSTNGYENNYNLDFDYEFIDYDDI